jgi:hypothetical protein
VPYGACVLAAVTAILCGGTAGAAETAGAATITRHVVAQDRAADQWSPKPGYNSTDNGDGTSLLVRRARSR